MAFRVPPASWMMTCFRGLLVRFLDGLHHQVHLAVLAAQGHHHGAVDIGVGGIAGHNVHGELLVGSHLGAAQLVVEGDGAHHLLGDDTGGIRGADTGRQDQDLVADAHAAVPDACNRRNSYSYPPSQPLLSRFSRCSSRLWQCTCSPALMSRAARPMCSPYLTMGWPLAMSQAASL